MKKKAKTPGLIGAPSIIVYVVEWLDAEDAVLFQSQLTIPWGERSAMGEFPGEGGEEIIYPQAGAVAVVVDGPHEDAEVVRITGGEPGPSNVETRISDIISPPAFYAKTGSRVPRRLPAVDDTL